MARQQQQISNNKAKADNIGRRLAKEEKNLIYNYN
jgi:hypothetical protein